MSTWPQCALRYDGTFAGFLTCVGESFRQKTYPFYFLPPGAEQITLYPLQEIPSDPALARAVYRALETAVSPAFRRMMTYGFLTCLPQRERSLFDLIYLAFHHALPQDPTDDRILLLTRAIGHLVREAEHYRGFVRFADYGGVLVGQIAPKNRVLPLLRPHFCARYSGERFVIYDHTHREALFYQPGRWAIVPLDRFGVAAPDQAELDYRRLWRRFYDTIAIEERRNPKCRMTHMPKRYWNTMTEFQTDPAPAGRKERME